MEIEAKQRAGTPPASFHPEMGSFPHGLSSLSEA
jgi:hypothetical protein